MRRSESPVPQERLPHDPEWKRYCNSTSGWTLPIQSAFLSIQQFELSCEGTPRYGPRQAVWRSQTPREAPSIQASPFRRSQFLFGQTQLVRGQRLYNLRQVYGNGAHGKLRLQGMLQETNCLM